MAKVIANNPLAFFGYIIILAAITLGAAAKFGPPEWGEYDEMLYVIAIGFAVVAGQIVPSIDVVGLLRGNPIALLARTPPAPSRTSSDANPKPKDAVQ